MTMMECAFRALAHLDDGGRYRAIRYLESRLLGGRPVAPSPRAVITPAIQRRRSRQEREDERAAAILETVAGEFNLTLAQMLSRSREQPLARARQAAMLALHRRGFSYPAIARLTKRADHTTALHGVRHAQELEQQLPGFAALVERAAQADTMEPSA